MLTTQEVAERLGRSEPTITRWANRGVFPGAKKLGRPWMIPAEDVERIEREGLDLSEIDARAGTAEVSS